mmetsp:Transcript_11639/g.48805  ORF Transcript_11639/g.48805 Transcript_11639/m.48805 type:complete len:287 (+) Transcript_11639:552-1412(+)
MQSRKSFLTGAGVSGAVAHSCRPANTASRMGRMCCASAASLGSIASAASRIHAILSSGSSVRSDDSCCASESSTPCDSAAGVEEKMASRLASAREHTHATTSTEDMPSAFVNAPSKSPASTDAPSATVGSMRDSSSANEDASPPGAFEAPPATSISAATRTSSVAPRSVCTSGPTSAATAFSFCVYSSAASSSIPRSNVDFTCANISLVAFSNLGTTVVVIAAARALGNAAARALASASPPPLSFVAVTTLPISPAMPLSSFLRIFSICTGRSRVIAAETAVSSCF